MRRFGNKDGSLMFIETNFGYSVYIEGKNRSKLIKKEIVEKILNLTDQEKEKLFEDILFNVNDILLIIGRYINDGNEFDDGLDIFGDVVTNEEFEISEDEELSESKKKDLILSESLEEVNNRDPNISRNKIKELELSKYSFENFVNLNYGVFVEGEPENKRENRIKKMNYVYLFTVGLRKEIQDYCEEVIYPRIIDRVRKEDKKEKLKKLFEKKKLYYVLEECQESCTYGISQNYPYSESKLRNALGLNRNFRLEGDDKTNYKESFETIQKVLLEYEYFRSYYMGTEKVHSIFFIEEAYRWYHGDKK